MSAHRRIYGLAATLAMSAALFCLREAQSHRRQRGRLDHLQQEARRHRNMIEENQEMRAALGAAESPDLAALRRDLDDARNDLRNLQRAHTGKSKWVWPDGTTVLDAGQWQDVGAGTPANAVESFLWAGRSGHIDQLTQLIMMQPLTRAEASSAFAELPAATQAEYGTPEKMIATYIAANLPDYDATAQIRSSPINSVVQLASYRMADASGDQRDLTFLLMKSSQGTWQLCVPHSAVAQYVADLQSYPALK